MNDKAQQDSGNPVGRFFSNLVGRAEQALKHFSGSGNEVAQFSQKQADGKQDLVQNIQKGLGYLGNRLQTLTNTDEPLSPAGQKTKDAITKIQQEEASKPKIDGNQQDFQAQIAKFSGELGLAVDVLTTEENLRAWQGKSAEVKKFYEETFPKLPPAQQREIAKNIAIFEKGDVAFGNSQDLQGGAYAIAKIIHDHTHDIQDKGNAALQLGSNVMQRVGMAFNQGREQFMHTWNQHQGDIGQKFMASVQAGVTAFTGVMSHSPEQYMEDFLVERSRRVIADLTKLGYHPNFSQLIGNVATELVGKEVKEKINIQIDVGETKARIKTTANEIAQARPQVAPVSTTASTPTATPAQPTTAQPTTTPAQQEAKNETQKNQPAVSPAQTVDANAPVQPSSTPIVLPPHLESKTISV
ncbi:MAG: hypothetical protein EAY65_03075 [Alphaproteobacteria bacterium]|nr:MAG: hypothetical protein EAY65_03075 [Alphaproteobacteria bacterium]